MLSASRSGPVRLDPLRLHKICQSDRSLSGTTPGNIRTGCLKFLIQHIDTRLFFCNPIEIYRHSGLFCFYVQTAPLCRVGRILKYHHPYRKHGKNKAQDLILFSNSCHLGFLPSTSISVSDLHASFSLPCCCRCAHK